jgi:hypothetical protein
MPRASEIFPITPLVLKVQTLILETFDVSKEQGLDYAAEMVSLAEGWGNPETAARLDWSYRIRKDLGEARKLPWRSQENREKFEAAERRKYREWDAIIRTKYRA